MQYQQRHWRATGDRGWPLDAHMLLLRCPLPAQPQPLQQPALQLLTPTLQLPALLQLLTLQLPALLQLPLHSQAARAPCQSSQLPLRHSHIASLLSASLTSLILPLCPPPTLRRAMWYTWCTAPSMCSTLH